MIPSGAPPKNDPRNIFGWCMYDWANSAYTTTVLAGLLPVYFARSVVGPEGAVIGGVLYHADALWGFVVSSAALLTFLGAPVLGSIADFTSAKKRFLLFFAYTGSLFTLLLVFCRPGDVLKTMLIFLVTQVCFIGANVFYDAFLPQIVTDDRMDQVSARGYAYGYAGGGVQFALALGLVTGHEYLGLSLETAILLSLAMAGAWWGGFTFYPARRLREAPVDSRLPERYRRWPRPLALAAVGFSRTLATTRRVKRYRHLALFLLAFFVYDDGVQTVVVMASSYATVELNLDPRILMLTLLLIQGVALGGALLFSRLAGRIGAKRAILVTLLFWSGITTYAYFLQTAVQFVVLGLLVGLVLGGTQALSRSFYASMIPEDASAEFYGFYSVFSKFSAIFGPMAFAVVKQMTGSSRLAILSLAVLFLAGLVLLSLVDEEKAREAKQVRPF